MLEIAMSIAEKIVKFASASLGHATREAVKSTATKKVVSIASHTRGTHEVHDPFTSLPDDDPTCAITFEPYITKPHVWDVKGRAMYRAAKSVADDRIPHAGGSWNVREAIKDLSGDNHDAESYLQTLLNGAHTKVEVREIIRYIKSHAADNLASSERANLMLACLNKLHFIDVIGQFLGGG